METEARNSKGQAARPWLVALSLWLALAAVAALALWHLRHETISSQGREFRLLTLASADAIERGLRGAEEGLLVMRAELEEGRLSLDDGEATQALHTRAGLMPLVQTLWVVSAGGQVIAASDASRMPDPAAFLPGLEALQRDGLALSRPFADASAQEADVALAIRYAGPRKTAGGWILAAMPAGALLGALGAALPAADARMLVLRRDGARLAAVNALPTTWAETDVAARLADRPSLEVRTFADRSDNLVGLQAVPRYEVKVLVSRDLAAVLTSWRQVAELAAAALTVLLVVMAAAVHLVQLAHRHRAEAQGALQARSRVPASWSRWARWPAAWRTTSTTCWRASSVSARWRRTPRLRAAPRRAISRRCCRPALRGKALVERILAFSRGGARRSTVFDAPSRWWKRC